ncbi:hypothetical protein [Flavobacterium sp. IMCC34518]|uniref:hypothetical protein n=1 Tax=Flavobacterium sp. IMCC34518 TaxID=3003623 RepID=UPI002482E89C|nr:hypothetical protein [Flavobacterium sp. IMCC34518]
MKHFENYLRFLIIVCFSLFYSCQSEINEQQYSTQETITKSSPLTSYLQRAAMVKTVEDNVIDQSSYCTIKFPYNITVNDVIIAINSAADYQKVFDNINANSNDNDVVKIGFPATMIYYNYTEKIIENQSEFDSLLAYWNAEPDLLSKINCLNINYPITINIYNNLNQIASSVPVTNDKLFFEFINNLNDSQFIALSYPISIVGSNNSTTIIENNSQFENAIKFAIDNCPNNSNTSLDFVQTITSNPWKVSYFFQDSDKTLNYNAFTFTFNTNYTVVAIKSGISYNGTWSSKINNGVREFEMKFESTLLKELDEGWKVFEFNNSQLRFRQSDDNTDNDYLYFEKK